MSIIALSDTKSKPKSIPIFIRSNGRQICVGHVLEDVFKKTGTIFHNLDAFGLEPSIIPQLKAYGVRTIQITDKDSSLVYSIGFDSFLANAFLVEEKWGSRLFCPRKLFKTEGNEQLKLVTD